MRYSVSLRFMWADLPLPERVRRAAAHGFDAVELWDWRGEDVDGCAAACRETGVELAGFFGHSYGGLLDPAQRDEVLSALAESVAVAERVGARQLHMFSDDIGEGSVIRTPPPLPWAEKLRSCVEGLRAAVQLIDGRPMELMVEAINDVVVPGYFLRDAGLSLALVRAVDHPQVAISYDCFHQQMAGGRLIDTLVPALPWTTAVHVADVPGRGPPGTGEINFHGIKRVLDQHGFDRQITFETVPADGDSDAAVAAMKAVWPF